ncbi:MAG: hypothetical protein ACO20H_11030 [Bacteriovoracaceae bacterium]
MIFLFLVSFNSEAVEKVDSFVIRFFSKKVVVLSPNAVNKHLSLIVENKTLSKLICQIHDGQDDIRDSFTVSANTTLSRPLNMKENDRLSFITLSPAFQAVPLIVGSEPYEVPPDIKE